MTTPLFGEAKSPLNNIQRVDFCVSDTVHSETFSSNVNIDHLELLYHYEHETCKTVMRDQSHIDVFRHTMLNHAFARPFLMQAILACSALHLSLKRPDKAKFYRNAAATLQSSALEGFQSVFPHAIDSSNVLDVVLFQHVIALQVFCDTFTTDHEDFNSFLEQLVGCIRLLRGFNEVLSTWWKDLEQTEIGMMMQTSHWHTVETPHPNLGECARLQNLIDAADLSATSIEICQESLSKLQYYFNAENGLGETSMNSTNMLFSWLISVSVDFTVLLEQRRPEALVVLAYYAVVLHRRRGSWAVDEAGEKLLKHIKNHLGKPWEEWLAWPSSVVSPTGSAAVTPA